MINRIFNYQRNLRRSAWYALTTFSGRIQARLTGAELGSNVKFYGKPFIQKASAGKLTIGKSSSFRSSATSNLIGINRPCILTVNPGAKLQIGDNCGFSGTVIGCFSEIILEKNVRCGANTLITDSDWHLDDTRSGAPRPIKIEENVWLGVNVTVMKGVTIGKNSVIGAGSIVTKNIPANVIAVGNPCKVLRSIDG